MAVRTVQAQGEHDDLVLRVVNHLTSRGYRNVRADLPGYTQPFVIAGTKQDHIPDVTADGVVVEVETADTIAADHTTSQWSLFADHASKTGQEFWVVVPVGADGAARVRLRMLGLQGTVYTA